ncbi:MAG: response regulator, partial [Blautia sp.]|nr:response regulator [Blautia sp.]
MAENALLVRSAGRILLHLVGDILDMSKLESGKMDLINSPYDLGALLSEVVGMIWVSASQKGLAFHVNIDPLLPRKLIGDEIRLKQILMNLLGNAVKYTPQGSITLSVQRKETKGAFCTLVFSVTDTGIGIKKESIPHLFSAFRRVDENTTRYIEGSGLGLSIVKQLLDCMGGTITVNSVYTKGSNFIAELPQEIADPKALGELDLEAGHRLSSPSRYMPRFIAPGARALVVDDNLGGQMVVTKLLKETQMEIDTAGSAEEALQKTLQKSYHLIFMDHLMPGMDGIACLKAIRTQPGGLCKEAKIVALTANADAAARALYAQAGFDGYLLKPASP